jgi:ACS family sodium-dependent inorganic phosphate cotransporter-like MFS transporter 5
MTSRACIAQFVMHFCHAWGVILFLTNAPTYMKEVLKFDIKSNGSLLSIPYISCLVAMISSGFISDTLIKRFRISPCKVRKLFNCIGKKEINRSNNSCVFGEILFGFLKDSLFPQE